MVSLVLAKNVKDFPNDDCRSQHVDDIWLQPITDTEDTLSSSRTKLLSVHKHAFLLTHTHAWVYFS